jgi:hypothetical protein
MEAPPERYFTATEIQALVRNMDDSKSKHRLLKSRNPEAYERKIAEENPLLHEYFYTIFKKHLKDELDSTFFYMLDMKRRIERGEQTEDEASTAVGQKLFSRWVAPVISNVSAESVQSYAEYYRNLSS